MVVELHFLSVLCSFLLTLLVQNMPVAQCHEHVTAELNTVDIQSEGCGDPGSLILFITLFFSDQIQS